MRKEFARALTSILLLLALLVQGTWVLAGTTGSISGVVTDSNGAPLSGAQVTVASPSQNGTATTNAQGKYAFASLAPDTYTVSVTKPGYQPVTQAGVTVTADQDNQQSFTTATSLATIGRTRSRSTADLVKAGTIQDVYTINPAQQAAVQGLGGGGSLNQAYSAISSLPGVYVPQGQSGWAQSVYIRGGNYTSLGYEYDGIPTQRAFDAYPGGTVSALGQQELQVYTGSAPADASSNGLAGFINQVIKTGTYPLTKTAILGWGGPANYHKGQFEVGGATPSRSVSFYGATAAYQQDFRFGDQFNGAGYTDKFSTAYANVISANCTNPALATAGCYSASDPVVGLPKGPSGFVPLPFLNGFNDRNVAGELVGNVHIALPQKNGNRDDIQLLANASWNRGIFENSILSLGNRFSDVLFGKGIFNGVPYGPCPGATPDTPCGINANNGPAFVYNDSYRYGGPVGTALTPGSITNVYQYLQPKSRQHAFGAFVNDPNFRDAQDINASVMKVQYQKNFGSDSFLRLYGYTFSTSWINGNGGPAVEAGGFNGTSLSFNSPDYDLVSHERGASLQFVKQFSNNLVSLTGSYVTATTTRWNDAYYPGSGGPQTTVAVLVDSTNPTSGVCYNTSLKAVYCGSAAGYRLPGFNTVVTGLRPTFTGHPNLLIGAVGANTCGAGPCEYFVTDTGYKGSYNQVKPQFTSASLGDTWKPNDKLTLDLALKFDNFNYVLPDTTTPGSLGFPVSTAGRALYNNSYNLFHCFANANTGVTTTATPGGCAPGTQLNFTTVSPGGFRYAYLEPRFGATYQLNRGNVLRVSAGEYVQPTNTAYTQYNRVEANLAAYDVPKFYGNGFTGPAHGVRPEKSQNFDFSWEHSFNGTDASFKLTPFYRATKDEDATVLLDPVTNFVSAINVGQKKVQGVELAVRKGDFTRNGLAGQFSYTYTFARIKFKPLPSGLTALNGVNQSIKIYNAYTAFCGSNPTDARCGTTNSGVAAAPCYTPAGAADPACAAGSVANPYWNAPVQGLFDPGAEYVPYNQLPGTGLGAVASSYIIPHVASLVLSYRHDKLQITPTLQFAAGGKYGSPVNGIGIDPTTCGALAGVTPDKARYPYGAAGGTAYDAISCTATLVSPDFFTGKFDTFGQFTEPSQLVGNLQVSYDISKRMTVTVLAANLLNRCFGGSSVPWSAGGDGRVNCWYTSPNGYVGNFFNPGSPLQQQVAFPYGPAIGSVFQQAYGGQGNPFNLFVNLSLKL